MTSFAFILGVVPLVIAEGAGSEMRRTLGTAVFAGMLGVTLFGIFLTPVFYYVIRWLGERACAVIRRLRPPTILRAIWPKPHPSRVLLKVEDGPYWLKRRGEPATLVRRAERPSRTAATRRRFPEQAAPCGDRADASNRASRERSASRYKARGQAE